MTHAIPHILFQSQVKLILDIGLKIAQTFFGYNVYQFSNILYKNYIYNEYTDRAVYIQ